MNVLGTMHALLAGYHQIGREYSNYLVNPGTASTFVISANTTLNENLRDVKFHGESKRNMSGMDVTEIKDLITTYQMEMIQDRAEDTLSCDEMVYQTSQASLKMYMTDRAMVYEMVKYGVDQVKMRYNLGSIEVKMDKKRYFPMILTIDGTVWSVLIPETEILTVYRALRKAIQEDRTEQFWKNALVATHNGQYTVRVPEEEAVESEIGSSLASYDFLYKNDMQFASPSMKIGIDQTGKFVVRLRDQSVDLADRHGITLDNPVSVPCNGASGVFRIENYHIYYERQIFYRNKVLVPLEKSIYRLPLKNGTEVVISHRALEMLLDMHYTLRDAFLRNVHSRINERRKIVKITMTKVDITQVAPTGRVFIAKLINGLPSFSAAPCPHASEEIAIRERRRLMKKHPGVQFCIYPEMGAGAGELKLEVR